MMFMKQHILMILYFMVLSKVIVNGMFGSSWKFCSFVMLSLKTLNLDREIIK